MTIVATFEGPLLAHCPICASRGEYRQPHYGPEWMRRSSWYVVCEYNCVRIVGEHGAKETAAAQWNRRPLISKLDEILEDARRRVAAIGGRSDG